MQYSTYCRRLEEQISNRGQRVRRYSVRETREDEAFADQFSPTGLGRELNLTP
jgi:hypothetical protein